MAIKYHDTIVLVRDSMRNKNNIDQNSLRMQKSTIFTKVFMYSSC